MGQHASSSLDDWKVDQATQAIDYICCEARRREHSSRDLDRFTTGYRSLIGGQLKMRVSCSADEVQGLSPEEIKAILNSDKHGEYTVSCDN